MLATASALFTCGRNRSSNRRSFEKKYNDVKDEELANN
jgi:hypothetical protein